MRGAGAAAGVGAALAASALLAAGPGGSGGREAPPYLLDRVGSEPEPVFREPVALSRRFVRGQSAILTLDLREPVLKSELVLSLPGDNFRRRVKVQGKNKHERQWTTLTDGAYVFAVPEPAAARYETPAAPERLEAAGRARVLRVRIRNRDDRPLDLRGVIVMVPQERLVFEAVPPHRYHL